MMRVKRPKLFYICAVCTVALLLLAVARYSAGFAEWYALHIFPLFPHTLGRLFSLLPFSLAELLLLALVTGTASLLILAVISLPHTAGRARLKRLLPRLGRALPPAIASLLLLFMLCCGINYHRASIAVYMGIETRPASTQELLSLCSILVQQAQESAPRDSSGQIALQRQQLHSEARATMRQLSHRYAGLAGYYPRPKPLMLSEGMSWLQLSGIYSPFTIEANYNSHGPMVGQPFAVCHELAHLGGYAREDEANFIAYLACAHSSDAAFRYSGAFQALIYVLNALYSVATPQEYAQLIEQLPQHLRHDLQQSSAYWQQYEGQAAELSQQVNDAYLKANSQTDGVQSYGRMVDLLLAYYAAK